MNTSDNDLLRRELGKIGELGSKLATELLGDETAGEAAKRGGKLGAQFAAKFLPTERHQVETILEADPRTVLSNVYAFFSKYGRVAEDDEVGSSSFPKISGVIGSGFLKMNPAVVHVEIVGIEDNQCTLLISGAAKEGLIKQHTAEKAVKRLHHAIGA